jgi:voltage-gated potassium channel
MSRKKYTTILPDRLSAHQGLLFATFIGFLVVSTGTIGYSTIEGWGFVDSLYMTITTLTTVGFGEVHPLSTAGRVFTTVLILSGVGGATYFFSTLISVVVDGELRHLRRLRIMKKDISKLSNHTIICGAGRLGRIVIQELSDANQSIVVIDNEPTSLRWLEDAGIPYVQGSAYEDKTLSDAGIGKARALLSLLPKDSDNVYVTLCARDLNPNLVIIARTEDESGDTKLRRAGADQVLAPYRVAGSRLAQRLVRPHVSDFLELAGGKKGHSLVIEEVVVSPTSQLIGKSLADCDLRNKTGAVVAACITVDGEMLLNPSASSIIQPLSTLIVMGERTSLDRLSELL